MTSIRIENAVSLLVSNLPVDIIDGAIASGLSMDGIVNGLTRIVSGTDNLGIIFDHGIDDGDDYYHNVAESFYNFVMFLDADDDGLDIVEEFVALINNA